MVDARTNRRQILVQVKRTKWNGIRMKLLNLDSTHEKSRCLERRQVSFQQGLKVSSLFLIVRMDGWGLALKEGNTTEVK